MEDSSGSPDFCLGLGGVLRRRLSLVWLSPKTVGGGAVWRLPHMVWVLSFSGGEGAGWISFVGLRDRSARMWAWMGLHPCSW